jgi:hypothetical protein
MKYCESQDLQVEVEFNWYGLSLHSIQKNSNQGIHLAGNLLDPGQAPYYFNCWSLEKWPDDPSRISIPLERHGGVKFSQIY